MLHRILFIVFFLSAILVFSPSCLKKYHAPPADNPYGLPNATQTGQGTFGCRINGLNYISTYENESTFSRETIMNDTVYLVIAPKLISYFEFIIFVIPNPVVNQTNIIGVQSSIIEYQTDSTCQGVSTHPTQGNTISGNITIKKFDKLSAPKIISGIFNCDITIRGCDTLHITEGRFDYQLQ